jgi:hypothetical protein
MTAQTEMPPIPRISELNPKYREPRTIADMLPARREQMEWYVSTGNVPECHYAGHGPLTPRPLEGQTYEQMYCGIWFDCQECASGASFHSRELAHYHGEPYRHLGTYQKYDGAAWADITDAEAEAYWADRIAWHEESHRRMIQAARRKPVVTYDGKTYTVRSRKTEIPDFTTMSRIAVLAWLNSNTYAKGAGIRTKPNPLAGIGDAISLTVR